MSQIPLVGDGCFAKEYSSLEAAKEAIDENGRAFGYMVVKSSGINREGGYCRHCYKCYVACAMISYGVNPGLLSMTLTNVGTFNQLESNLIHLLCPSMG